MDPSLVEIRPGRHVHIEATPSQGNSNSSLPVLLFVHGSCAHSGQWDAQLAWLLQRKDRNVSRVIRYDYFGCGKSLKPEENAARLYSASEHYADLEAIFTKYCEASSEVWVIGHSFGCSMSLRLASEHVDKVTKLVLIAPTGVDFGHTLPSLFSLPKFVLGWMQPILRKGFVARAFHPDTLERMPSLIENEQQMSDANPPYMFKAYYNSMPEYYNTEANQDNHSKWFQKVTYRVLLIYGEDDQITPPGKISGELVQKFANAELALVATASHQVHQEQAEHVNALLDAYLFAGADKG